MRRYRSWLVVFGLGVALALPFPSMAHQQIGLKLKQINAELAHHPDDPDLYIQRGELYRLNREWALAEGDFRKAVALNQNNPDLQFYLGRLWFEAGHYEPARSALDRFIVAHPNHVEGHVIRGRVLGELGEWSSAVADYNWVIERSETPEPEYYLQRARWQIASDDAQIDVALRDLNEAIDRLGPLVTLVAFAIDIELSHGRYEAALARFADLPAGLSEQPYWLARRGDVLHSAGRSREALSSYANALAAIEGLPAKRRTVRATATLEERLHGLLVSGG